MTDPVPWSVLSAMVESKVLDRLSPSQRLQVTTNLGLAADATDAQIFAAYTAQKSSGFGSHTQTDTPTGKVAAGVTRISAAARQYAEGGLFSDDAIMAIKGTGDGGEITVGDLRVSRGMRREPFESDAEQAAYYGIGLADVRAIKARTVAAQSLPIAAGSGRTPRYVGAVDPALNPLVAKVLRSVRSASRRPRVRLSQQLRRCSRPVICRLSAHPASTQACCGRRPGRPVTRSPGPRRTPRRTSCSPTPPALTLPSYSHPAAIRRTSTTRNASSAGQTAR